jgi:hypothetical protein
LQKSEKTAEYISACHGDNGSQRLDRILSKQKSGRQKVDSTHDCLKNRNEGINTTQVNTRERYYDCIQDREHNERDERNIAVPRAYRLSRDSYWEILIWAD